MKNTAKLASCHNCIILLTKFMRLCELVHKDSNKLVEVVTIQCTPGIRYLLLSLLSLTCFRPQRPLSTHLHTYSRIEVSR